MGEDWTRRRALRLGAAGLAGLAGCASDGGGPTTSRTRRRRSTSTRTATTATDSTTAESTTTAPDGSDEFVDTDGRHFTLGDEPWYFNGAQYTNFPFEDDRLLVDEVLADIASVNANVVRTRVGCAGRGPVAQLAGDFCLQPKPGEYNERGFKLLDYAIAESKRHGLRFVMWLANRWRLAGNGISQYVSWATDEPIPDGESPLEALRFRDRFYTNEDAKQLYKDFVEYVLTRENTYTGVEYRHDPSIMLWELVNEGTALPENRDAFLEWHREMASFVSDLTPDQLVGTGGQGYYADLPKWADESDRSWLNVNSGSDFVEDNQIDDIDACSFHMYPDDLHGHSDFTTGQTHQWIRGHVADAHERVGKPVYCGEWAYGARRDAEHPAEQIARRNRKYEQYFQWFDEYDLDGSIVYELLPGEPHPYPHDNAVYCPGDEQTCALISQYGRVVAEKSDNGENDTTAGRRD